MEETWHFTRKKGMCCQAAPQEQVVEIPVPMQDGFGMIIYRDADDRKNF